MMVYWKIEIIDVVQKIEWIMHVKIYFSFILFSKVILNVSRHGYVHPGAYRT